MDAWSKKTLAMPIYSIQEGNYLGSVKGLLIDSSAKAVCGLVVERRRFNREARFIPFNHIKSIGEDVITVDKSGVAADRRQILPQTLRQMRSPFILIGARVFTTGGKILGKVEEYRFSPQTGQITGLELNAGALFKDAVLLKAAYITAMTSGTVMVEDAALEDYETIGNNLRFAMESAMEKAGSVLNGAVSASKKLGQEFSQAVNKLKGDDLTEADPDAEGMSEEAAVVPDSAPAVDKKESTDIGREKEDPAPKPYAGLSKDELKGMANVVVVERPLPEEEAAALVEESPLEAEVEAVAVMLSDGNSVDVEVAAETVLPEAEAVILTQATDDAESTA